MQDDRKTITGAPVDPPSVPAFQATVDCSEWKAAKMQDAREYITPSEAVQRALATHKRLLAEIDEGLQAEAERNMHPDTRELGALQRAIKAYFDHPCASNEYIVKRRAGLDVDMPSTIEAPTHCPDCGQAVDTDTGFCGCGVCK